MNFDEVWDRICSTTNWRKYGEMADFLEIKSPTISGAKNRGTFPIEWAFKIAQGFDLSTDWLLTGKGSGSAGSPSIDEDFFIRVTMVVESVLSERKLVMPLWNRLQIIIFLYETCLGTKRLDPDHLQKVISLAASNASILDQDKEVLHYIELLAAAETEDFVKKAQSIDKWWARISEKFNAPGLLLPMEDQPKVVDWLKLELNKRIKDKYCQSAQALKDIKVTDR